MKKRTVIEEAYRIYWALGTLVGRASALSSDNDRKITDGAEKALAVMGECLASLEGKGDYNGGEEENA